MKQRIVLSPFLHAIYLFCRSPFRFGWFNFRFVCFFSCCCRFLATFSCFCVSSLLLFVLDRLNDKSLIQYSKHLVFQGFSSQILLYMKNLDDLLMFCGIFVVYLTTSRNSIAYKKFHHLVCWLLLLKFQP